MKRIVMIVEVCLLLVIMSACAISEAKTLTTADVVQQFKDDGLEVGEISELPSREFGDTRIEGIRIAIPSIGDVGARVFLFDNDEDLAAAKAYYDDSASYYSHTYQVGHFLLQMNGDMNDEDFKKYADSMDKLK